MTYCNDIHSSLVSLGLCLQTRVPCSAGESERVVTIFDSALLATFIVAGSWLEQQLDTQSEDSAVLCVDGSSEPVHIKKLAKSLVGIAEHESMDENITDCLPALQQLLSLLDVVPRGKELVCKSELELKDCTFLQCHFQNFRLADKWFENLQGDELREFERQVRELEARVRGALWGPELRAKVHQTVMSTSGLDSELLHFKDLLPTEYKSNSLPAVFNNIPAEGLTAKLVATGDERLSKQVGYLLAHHRCLIAGSACAVARGESCGLGEASRNMPPVDVTHVKLVGQLRAELMHALTHQQHAKERSDLFASINIDIEDEETMHHPIFDGWLEPLKFSEMALAKCHAELQLWHDSYIDSIRSHVGVIENNVPGGWQAAKEALLDPEHKEVVSSLLGNKGYMELCTSVAKLCEQMDALKPLQGDGYAGPLAPDLRKRALQAISNGTDTVAITFALYQLTNKIPQLKKADRAPAIQDLKKKMKAKKACLGRSLEAECTRLLGAPDKVE